MGSVLKLPSKSVQKNNTEIKQAQSDQKHLRVASQEEAISTDKKVHHLDSVKDKSMQANLEFAIREDYDFSQSTEYNYAHYNPNPEPEDFTPQYRKERMMVNYEYHRVYSKDRQLFQDKILEKFLKTKVIDKKNMLECEVPLNNWIVFTAGTMGAGKGHTIKWLEKKGFIINKSFVVNCISW